jgi:predicted PhzF superfamily epimerase YddE/YHI9
MGQMIFQVDGFADTPFLGNPAGVCIMLEPGGDAAVAFGLRWFTPVVEVV